MAALRRYRARNGEGGVFASNALRALLVAEGEAEVVHYGWSKRVSVEYTAVNCACPAARM